MQYIKTDDNTKIAVFDYNPKCRKTIFLIHGWPLSHEIFEYQINMLTACGYRVTAIDLRGFGQSDSPACGYTYDRMSADIYCVIKQMNLKNIIMAGFSMGGAIALRYMKNYKCCEVSKLILLSASSPCFVKNPDCSYGLSVQTADKIMNLIQTDRPLFCRNFSRQLFYNTHSAEALDWFRKIALSASGTASIQCLSSLKKENGYSDLKSINIPTCIIHGDKDIIVPKELAEIQHNEIKNSVLFTLPKSGHGIFYDEFDKFNSLFLKAIEI